MPVMLSPRAVFMRRRRDVCHAKSALRQRGAPMRLMMILLYGYVEAPFATITRSSDYSIIIPREQMSMPRHFAISLCFTTYCLYFSDTFSARCY